MFYAIINNEGRLLEVTNNDNPAALAAYFSNGERGCFRKAPRSQSRAQRRIAPKSNHGCWRRGLQRLRRTLRALRHIPRLGVVMSKDCTNCAHGWISSMPMDEGAPKCKKHLTDWNACCGTDWIDGMCKCHGATGYKCNHCVDELVAMLRRLEWLRDGELDERFCPICGNSEDSGHLTKYHDTRPTCELGDMLKRLAQERNLKEISEKH